jgi:hypothetical protein
MKTHGMRRHPLYKTWAEMRYRCENPAKHNYRHYGGRGIKVCERWQEFPNFVADMGGRPQGATLDRIDLNGDYEPSNCRWATKTQQMRNMTTNRILTFNDQSKTLAEWSEITGLKVATIWARLELYGWTVEKALTRHLQNARAERL